jgi:hypothetical protein
VLRVLSVLALVAVLVAPAARAQSGISLEGRWDLLLDPDNRGLQNGLSSGTGRPWAEPLKVFVPGVLEAAPAAAGYDGIAWYRTTLPAVPSPPAGAGRLMLQFGAVNWRADVWLDGRPLGRHDGADAPFRFDVTGRLERAGAVLVVRCVDPGSKPVEGLVLSGLPNAWESSDYNWGGLTGTVTVQTVSELELLRLDPQLLPDDTAQLRLDLHNHGAAPRRVTLRCTLRAPPPASTTPGSAASAAATPAPEPATTSAPAAEPTPLQFELEVELPPGETRVTVPCPGAEALPRWSPATPVAHALVVELDDGAGTLRWERRFALRRFAIEGSRFTLDGQPIAVRGVLYPPTFPRTLALPPDADFLRRELTAIRSAGFNLVRLRARVLPELYTLCDELGLLVQAEPVLGIVTHELPETAGAARDALVTLADAVAGHPSVVMVSLLDEHSSDLWRLGDALFALAQARLPERLLIEESGGGEARARARNPHVAELLTIDDVHLPREGVLSPALRARIAGLGAGHERLVYVSAWGASGLPDIADTIGGFGGRLLSEDARDYVSRLQSVSAQLRPGTPLTSLVHDAAQLSLLGQAVQARAVADLGDALRANPRIAGDCLVQWRDSAWQDAAGLCSVWGTPKAALTALKELNARSEAKPIDAAAASRVLPERATRLIAAGSLVDLAPEVEAVVAPLVDRRAEGMAGMPRLAVIGSRPQSWSVAHLNVTVALLRFVRDGGTLLWLSAPDAGRPLPQQFFGYDGFGQVAELPIDVAARRARGAGVETVLLFAQGSPLLADLPGALPFVDESYAALLPRHLLLAGPGTEADVQLGAVAADGSYAGAAVQAIPYGSGHLVLSTLPFDAATLQDPLARRLLENLVRYAAGIAGRKPPPPPTSDTAPPADLADALARMLWRAELSFGLAERLALQSFPGRPLPRDELPTLAALVQRKCAGLDAVICGRTQEGMSLLQQLDRAALGDESERFLRTEITLADTFAERAGLAPPLSPPLRGEVLEAHARALRLMRLGEVDAALASLGQAAALLVAPPTDAAAPGAPPPEVPALAVPEADR